MAIQRMLAWGRLDPNQRARLEKNEELAAQVLGPDPGLDPALRSVLDVYLRIRRKTSADLGIELPDRADPILRSYLSSLDDAYLEDRAVQNKQQIDEMKNARHKR